MLMMLVMKRMMIIMTPEGSQGAETKAHFFHPWVGALREGISEECNAMGWTGINLTQL